MAKQVKTLPAWFPYIDLACAVTAGGLLYALPQLGSWPLTLAVLPWIVRLGVTGRLTQRTAYDLLLALFILTAGIGVWAAYDHEAAWHKFCLAVGAGFIFYALVNARPTGEVRVWLLAFFGAGLAAYFVVTHDWQGQPAKIQATIELGKAIQAALPTLPGHRLNPNVAGGMMAIMMPFAGLAVVRAGQRVVGSAGPRPFRLWLTLALALGLAVATSFGVVMTMSRGAWLGVAGAAAMAGAWTASRWLARGRVARQAWILPGLLASGLAAILVVAMLWPQVVTAAVDALPGPNTAIARVTLLRNSLTLVRDYPLTGAGLAGFPMLYSSYGCLLHVLYQVHAHNLFFDVAIEQGIPAVLLLISMWILFAHTTGATLRGVRVSQATASGRARLETAAMAAAALSVTILLVHGLVDNVLYESRGILLLFVPLAFGVPLAEAKVKAAGRWRSWAWPVGVGLVAIMALVWARPGLSLIFSNLGAVHQSQAELSVYSWPEWPIQDAVRRAVDLRRPIAEFERALAWDPANATANRRLGMIELSLGEYQDALNHLEAAYAAEPGSMATRQLLGEALVVNGRVDEGQALWAEVDSGEGQLRLRAAWYRRIGDSTRAQWVDQAARSR